MVFFTHDFAVDLSRITKSRYGVIRLRLGETGLFCEIPYKTIRTATALKESAGNVYVSTLEYLLTIVSGAVTRSFGRVLMREQMPDIWREFGKETIGQKIVWWARYVKLMKLVRLRKLIQWRNAMKIRIDVEHKMLLCK